MNGEERAPAVERGNPFRRPIVRSLLGVGALQAAREAGYVAAGGTAATLGAGEAAGTSATFSPPSEP